MGNTIALSLSGSTAIKLYGSQSVASAAAAVRICLKERRSVEPEAWRDAALY